MRRTNIYLTAQQLDKLAALAKATGLSIAELVRRAVDRFLSTRKD